MLTNGSAIKIGGCVRSVNINAPSVRFDHFSNASHDGHCEKSNHEYIQPEESNAVPLHAPGIAKPVGSDGCTRVNVFCNAKYF